MNRLTCCAAALLLLACTGRSAPPKAEDTGALPPADSSKGDENGSVDRRALARRLVAQSARIREGDLVFINGGERDLDLLEYITVETRRVGANPILTIGSDRLARMGYDEVPAKYDSKVDEMARRLLGFITVQIFVESSESDTAFKGVPPERIATRIKTFRPLAQLAIKRGIRQLSLGNQLYPTEDRARQFGMSQAQLRDIFWRGVDVDYDQLQATGARVRKQLAAGKEAHLTHPNGTDLRVRIEGRPVFATDGVISAEDEKRGGAAVSEWLPAGEVFVAPVPGTATGVVIADHYNSEGRDIEGLRLEFKAGKLVSMTAKSDLGSLKAFYDAAPAGKEELGVLDVGINPNVVIPEGTTLRAWMPAGMVTVVLGNNTWAGGTNTAVSGVAPFLPGTTLTVDDQVIVKDGKLQGSEQMAGR